MDKFVSDKLEEWKLSNLKDLFEGKFYEKLGFVFGREMITKRVFSTCCLLF